MIRRRILGATVIALTLAPVPIARAEPDPGRVKDYQARLLQLGYWLPSVNGQMDRDTKHAVIAIQKVAGLERTGELDSRTKAAISKGVRPKARSTATHRVVEVDRVHQVMLLVKNKKVLWIVDVSTGKPSTPTNDGWHHVYRSYDGMRASGMYRPRYFWRGAAVHGYYTVPSYAASHGCVRVTNNAMDWLWEKDALPAGMPVYIY